MTPMIYPATEVLLQQVEAWLDAEQTVYDAAVEAHWDDDLPGGEMHTRGFRCNWDTTVKHWREFGDPIHLLVVEGEPIAFLAGMDLLEVRPDKRRCGYGEILANFMLEQACAQGYAVAQIEIAPPSAEPFWKRMGFTPVPGLSQAGGLYAFRLLPRAVALGEGRRVDFRVGFYPENADADDTLAPFHEFAGQGEWVPGGALRLPERIIGFQPSAWQRYDDVVRIEVAGDQVYFDKAKYPEAKAFGVELDPKGVYFMDRIVSMKDQ